MVQSDRRENNFVPASDYKIVYKGSLKVKEEKSTKFVGDISLNMILYLNIDLKCSKTFFLELVWLSNHDKDCFMSVSVHSYSVILLFYLFWWSVAVVVVIWQYLCMSLYLWYHICILWFDTPFTILALMKLISYAQFEIFQHAPSFCHFPPPLWYVTLTEKFCDYVVQVKINVWVSVWCIINIIKGTRWKLYMEKMS